MRTSDQPASFTVEALVRDLSHACRVIRRRPGFASAVIGVISHEHDPGILTSLNHPAG